MVAKKTNPPIAKKNPAPKKVSPPKVDPNDLTPPPFLNRLKGKTKAELKAMQDAADRADRDEQTTWIMPSTNPVTAKAQAKSAIPAGAMTPKQIAAEVGMNDRKLRRLLRAMAKKGTLKHDANGRWALTKADLELIKKQA